VTIANKRNLLLAASHHRHAVDEEARRLIQLHEVVVVLENPLAGLFVKQVCNIKTVSGSSALREVGEAQLEREIASKEKLPGIWREWNEFGFHKISGMTKR
jgi:hypothetical protein